METTDERWVKRYRWHVESIPELLLLTRQAVVPLKATAYGERVQGGGDVRRLPMNGSAVDEADLLWALLVLYAREVAYRLGGSSPAVIRSAVWSTSEPQGLPAGTTPTGAHGLGLIVSDWLAPRALAVAEFAELQDTEDHLFAYVRALRSRYGMQSTDVERRRFCGVCGRRGVVAAFEDVGGAEFSRVWCVLCGHEVEGVMRVDDAHIPAGRATRRPVDQDGEAVAAARAPDGAR